MLVSATETILDAHRRDGAERWLLGRAGRGGARRRRSLALALEDEGRRERIGATAHAHMQLSSP